MNGPYSSKSEISLTNWPGRSFYTHVTLKVDVKPSWNYLPQLPHVLFKLDILRIQIGFFYCHFHPFSEKPECLNAFRAFMALNSFFFSFILVIHWVQNFSTWLKNSTYIIIKTQEMFSQKYIHCTWKKHWKHWHR